MAITINIELTDHCNIRCKMCSQSLRAQAHGVPKKFISWSIWHQSLHNLSNFEEEIHLCPHWLGEPTLHPYFDRFIEYAFAINTQNHLFQKFKLHTNAVVFSKQRSRLLLQLAQLQFLHPQTFNFIHFSVDAFSKETYKIVKGANKRDQVYQNILDFIKLRHELNLSYPKITIAFVVQPENAHEAIAFQRFWLSEMQKYDMQPSQFYDWPSEEVDCLYFRRLNCADQEKSDQLHAKTALDLGLTSELTSSLRRDGSF